MSLRHAMLGLLSIEPSTGYALTQRFDQTLANAWHATHSQIYPELARLQADGMVEVVGEGPRQSRTWAVTPAGHEELRRWMTDSEPNRNQRNETALRWFLFALLPDADRRAAVERELAFVESELARLEAIKARIAAAPDPPRFGSTVELGLGINRVMRAWLREQLD